MENNLWLIFAFAALLAIYGCAGNSYVPCCTKENLTGSPPYNCVFANPQKTVYGPCLPRNPDGTANCTNTQCGSPNITNVQQCAAALCVWDTSTLSCRSSQCSDFGSRGPCEDAMCSWDVLTSTCGGGLGSTYQKMAVCADVAPKNCINGRCTAMMCGFKGLKPSPPISSSDWNAIQCQDPSGCGAFPTSEIADGSTTGAVNLYQTSCNLRTMNVKLYNEVKNSRGSLWVNAFRFGVGSSFSDFEAAKNFFPVSDKLCSANPLGTVDRYINYIGRPATYCNVVPNYYQCTSNLLNFTDRNACLNFCGQDILNCNIVSASDNYACLETDMAYSSQQTCFSRCDTFSDASKCTINTAPQTPYGFLEDDGRYRTLYEADYFATAKKTGNGDYTEVCGVSDWSTGYHDMCEDFSVTRGSDGEGINRPEYMTDGPWKSDQAWGIGSGYRFQDRKIGATDFDRPYYEQKIIAAYPRSDPGNDYDSQLPFECSSSLECISGYCNTQQHKRSLVNTDPGRTYPLPKSTMELNCTEESGGLSCLQQVLSPLPGRKDLNGTIGGGATAAFDMVGDGTARLLSDDTDFDVNGRHIFRYYALGSTDFASPPTGPLHSLFSACNVRVGGPTYPSVNVTEAFQCVRWMGIPNSGGVIENVKEIIFDGDLDCSNPNYDSLVYNGINYVLASPNAKKMRWVQKYEMDISQAELQSDGTMLLGACKVKDNTKHPFLDTLNLGWCEGCTYATMAAQRVEWPGWTNDGWLGDAANNMCYSFRGKYDYAVGTGPLVGDSSTPIATQADLQNIRSDKEGVPLIQGGIRRDAAADWVRRTYSVGGVSDESNFGRFNGGIARSDWNDGDYVFTCEDRWKNDQWWGGAGLIGGMPAPSAPYLGEKLVSYLQSNIMPVLDVRDIAGQNEEQSQTQLTSIGSIFSTVSPPVLGVCTPQMIPVYICPSNHIEYSSPSSCSSSCSGSCITTTTPYYCQIGGYRLGAYDANDCDGHCTGSGLSCVAGSTDRGVCSFDGRVYPDMASCSNGCKITHGTQVAARYNPTDICTLYGGNGASVYAVMDAERLLDTGSFDSGWATRADTKVIGGGFGFPLVYFSKEDDILDDAIASNYLESGVEYKITTGPGGLDAYSLGAKAEAINRGLRLKSVCKNPPIVGLAISQDTVGQDGNAADYWTGHYDALGNFVPGGSNLHQFFFKDDGTIQYNNRVKQGNPDDNPKKAVDMFLQDWKPMCDQLSASSPLLDKVQYEVGEKMNFSRALLYAYSKPSLIWKFHFPDNSQCFQMVGGKRDYGLFLDYLFNVTGEMVDAGMLGIIYDSWSAEGSMSYSPDPLAVGSYGGLTDVVAEGALDNPVAGGSGGKEFTPFCELQKNSRKVLGITKNSYGQVLVAENSACTCAACTDTDYLTGACKLAPPGVTYTYPNNLPPQMFCNDASPCVMPAGYTGTDYENYKCPRTCVDENKCVQCGDISTQTSFCKIDNSGEIFFANRTYGTLDDDYWEFLAGLPAQDKCCLERVTPGGETQEYTYDMRSGNKQRSEFLQYPTRGEAGIDCGRVPDTSFLKYCNIRIPISSREAVCWKVPSS